MRNLSNDMLPISMSSLFKRSDQIISGRENDILLATINTEAKRRFISFNGVKVWEKIPEHLKTTNTFHQFKKDLSNIY